MKTCKTCGTEVPDNATSCPTCGGPVGDPVVAANGTQPASSTSPAGPPKKKRTGLKVVAIIVAVIVAICVIASCNNSCSKQAASTKEDWPTGALAQMIPSMDRKCASVAENKDSLYIVVSDRINKESFNTYVSECKEHGFTVDTTEDSTSYEAFNPEGYKLSVRYSDFSNDMTINLDAPKTNGELIWPTAGLATKIPNPGKAKGSIAVDSSSQFTVYVGEMDKATYDAYVAKCIEKGFDTDYSKNEKSFNAKNKQGDSLHLEYQGFNTMYISMYAAKDESSSSSSSTSSSSTPSSSSISNSTSPTTDFKKTMDDYEKFVDNYIAFMKKYNSSSDQAGMASDYAEYMSDYFELTEEIDAIDENNLTSADKKYYTEVMARVSKKLVDASL